MTSQQSSLLEMLQCELKNKPKDEIVRYLAEVGSVETLTELKIAVGKDACDAVPDFPMGEFYTRRKPKGRSAFNTLEHRLAADIAELFSSLDTGIVTTEIKAMFKTTDEHSRLVNSERLGIDNESLISNSQEEVNNNFTSAHQKCREQFVNMETDFLLFKEWVRCDISKLEKLVNEQGKLISIQDQQISDLLQLNANLQVNLKGIRQESSNCHSSCQQKRPTAPASGPLNPRGRRNTIGSIHQSLELRCEVSGNHSPVSNEPRNSPKQGVDMQKEKVLAYEIAEEIPNVSEKQSYKLDGISDKNVHHLAKRQDQVTEKLLYSEKVKQSKQSSSTFHKQQKNAFPAHLSPIRSQEKQSDQQGQVEWQQQHQQQQQQKQQQQGEVEVERGDSSDGPFIGVERKRRKVKRFFLSGIAENVTINQMYDYLKSRNIFPTHLRTFSSKRKGTIGAKLNVLYSDSSKVLQTGFWPKFISCKPWLTKSHLEKVYKENKLGNPSAKLVLS